MRKTKLPFNEETFLNACRENGVEFAESGNENVGVLYLEDANGVLFKADENYNPFLYAADGAGAGLEPKNQIVRSNGG